MASYIDASMVKGEEIIYRANVSWWSLIPSLIIGAIFFIMGKEYPFLFFIGLMIIIPPIVKLMGTELALTNRRVIAKFGLINRNTIELKLDKIESIMVNQSISGRMLNYGDKR